jgi:hypothetical protein
MNQDLIEQYVAGKLGEAEAEAFEAYCVAHPEFAKQVEFEQRLRAGIAEIARGSTAEFVRANNPFAYRFAVAATVLVVLGAGFFGWRTWGTAATRPILTAVASDAPNDSPALRLAQVRGAADRFTLQDDTVRVEIVGLFDSEYHYSVELARLRDGEHAEKVATLYSQHPNSPVTLEVMLHGERLPPGTYLLRVRKQSADEEPLEFDFVKD